MSIKAFCDAIDCGKEINNQNFYFDATVAEIKTGYDLASPNLNAQKQMQKRNIHICQECYNDKFVKLLK